MSFNKGTLGRIAAMICGDSKGDNPSYFPYRSSSEITRFFQDCDTDFEHDGSTRYFWVASRLHELAAEPTAGAHQIPDSLSRVVRTLMDQGDARNEDKKRKNALAALNAALEREGYEAFYSTDDKCYMRHVATNTVAASTSNPHRPLSAGEIEKQKRLIAYLDTVSEDELISEVLLPLFRQLGFSRITAAGHKDKALEYGKDIWMRYALPTQHLLYFGIQAKKGKLDASSISTAPNVNVSEVYHQATMMLGHEVFDPEVNRRILVDHAIIVAGGEITKAARGWIGNKLDALKRSQIIFMDREDIVNLFIVSTLSLPSNA